MDERFAILTLLSAEAGGRLTGRTLLQKKVYFLNEILDLGVEFRPYYYGPYSEALANALDSLVAIGFVKEECETFPRADDPFGDQRRYHYSLTLDGEAAMQVFAEPEDGAKAQQMVELVRKMDQCAQAHDYRNLSVAAKIYFIVRSKGRASVEELKKEALSLRWKLPDDLIRSSIAFLKSMGLVSAPARE
jgi:uncharacterized protein YwgA